MTLAWISEGLSGIEKLLEKAIDKMPDRNERIRIAVLEAFCKNVNLDKTPMNQVALSAINQAEEFIVQLDDVLEKQRELDARESDKVTE